MSLPTPDASSSTTAAVRPRYSSMCHRDPGRMIAQRTLTLAACSHGGDLTRPDPTRPRPISTTSCVPVSLTAHVLLYLKFTIRKDRKWSGVGGSATSRATTQEPP